MKSGSVWASLQASCQPHVTAIVRASAFLPSLFCLLLAKSVYSSNFLLR